MALYRCGGGGTTIIYIEKKVQQEFVTSEAELTCTTTASSTYGGSWPPWKAFTDNQSDCWIAGATDSWWKVEFPTAVNIQFISYANLDANRFHAIDKIYYSDDDSTWTEATPTSSSVGSVELPSGIRAKYWRFEFYGYSDSGQYPLLAHLKLQGYEVIS